MPKQKPRKLVTEDVILQQMDTFSSDYLDIDKMLRDLKSRSSLSADVRTKVNRLTSYIDSKLSELAQQATAANHTEIDSLRKMKKILLEIQMSEQYDYWYERYKQLDEEVRQLSDTELLRQAAAIEQLLNQVRQETERWHVQLLFEASEKIKLAERNEIEELMRQANARMQERWDEIERIERKIRENNKLLDQYEGRFNGLKNEVKAGGLLDRIKADNPQILPQKIDDAFNKLSIQDGKGFNRFAEDIGIPGIKIDQYIKEANLQDKVGEMNGLVDSYGIVSKENESLTFQESEEYRRLLEDLQNNLTILDAKSAEDRDRFLEDQAERIAKMPSQVFTDLFDKGIQNIEAVSQEQDELKAVLVDKLNSLLHIFKCRFGETSDEYQAAKTKIESLTTQEQQPLSSKQASEKHHKQQAWIEGGLKKNQPDEVEPAEQQDVVEQNGTSEPTETDELEKNHKLLEAKINALNKNLGELDDALGVAYTLDDGGKRADDILGLQEKIKEALTSCGPSQLATLSLDKTKTMLNELGLLEKTTREVLQQKPDDPQNSP